MSSAVISEAPGGDGRAERSGPLVPAVPVLVVGAKNSAWISDHGELKILARGEAVQHARQSPPILCHARAAARRLGVEPFQSYDILELFAFVRPARFCVPTPYGMAIAVGLSPSKDPSDQASLLHHAVHRLLLELAAQDPKHHANAKEIAGEMADAGWPWGPTVLSALGDHTSSEPLAGRPPGLRIWQRLREWEEVPASRDGGHQPVDPAEARTRLADLLDSDAEPRPQQADYTSAVSLAFTPPEAEGEPQFVMAEAGTGVGKTLGYIAPASLWAERNHSPVWLSTFTRNLQRQIDDELDRLYPHPNVKSEKVVIRKGRENYLCLLNYEEAVNRRSLNSRDTIAIGLLARWARRSRDGDMVGGDLPGWLPDLLGRSRTLGLGDRRGECIYAACPHYRKCFVEAGIRRAQRAEIVVANHALVMVQAALGGDSSLPSRYVFDEGHHLFDAADNAFAAHLSAVESAELRRWLLGSEAGRRSARRMRGLKRRVADLIVGDAETAAALESVLIAAHALPAEGWRQRLTEGVPQGPAEIFFQALRKQVYARAAHRDGPYSLECECKPAADDLLAAAEAFHVVLQQLLEPLRRLTTGLSARLDRDAAELESDTRNRIEASSRSLQRRAVLPVAAWVSMLEDLHDTTPESFVDWLSVERIDGRDLDFGLYRHWLDPMIPFAGSIATQAHGVAVTSATLTDGSGDPENDWAAAEDRCGAAHLPNKAIRAQVLSPFDYPAQTRVLVVGDVRKDDFDQVAAAYRELFLAAGGGALGLFTAISRLRAVHHRIAPHLEAAGLTLYAQHVDDMDTATLVDIFRTEADSCLLGTNAVRDGVDVPGRALRLIVFDRVPWPRPDLRHRARRAAFGGRRYDDMLTRLHLKQAYGRLIRKAEDRGIFVLLDPMLPSRLRGAFPEGVEVDRIGLAEAVAVTREFLSD